MAYTVHQTKTNFSRILKEVEAGQEVIVMRGKKPVAKKIIAVKPPAKPNVPRDMVPPPSPAALR